MSRQESGRSVNSTALKELPPALAELCGRVGEKAALKFRSIREAFRFIDSDHDGTIDRGEMRSFFRAYDYGANVADAVFDHLDPEGRGMIDHQQFVMLMSPFFNDYRPGFLEDAPNEHSQRADALDQLFRRTGTKEVLKEFKDVLDLIGSKAAFKFRNITDAWRYVDNDKNGAVSRGEMRHFFRAFNLDSETSDKLFDKIVAVGEDEIPYDVFGKFFAPYIQPDHTGHRLPMPSKVNPKGALIGLANPNTMKDLSRQGGGVAHGLQSPRSAARSKTAEDTLRSELRGLMQDIGTKLQLKFRHPRDAFRMLDLQRDGRITRQEMRAFFRGFGYAEPVADKIFDMLVEDAHGGVDFNAFMSHFDSMLGPQFRCAKRKPLIEMENKVLEKEVNDLAIVIGQRLTTKYKSVQDAFRAMDLNKDGTVQLSELKTFFRSFGMQPEIAEKVFGVLAADGVDEGGGVKYKEFMQLFADKRW